MSRAACNRGRILPAESVASLTQMLEGYVSRSMLPFTMLIFVGPMIVLYEVGTRYITSDWARQTETRVLAFNLIRQFMEIFGLPSRWMPGLAILIILLAWHIARRDPWKIHLGTALLMAGESVLLAFPLLAWARFQPSVLPLWSAEDWRAGVVLALGAGVYEEAIFRLGAFTIADLILIDLLRVRRLAAYAAIVAGTAVLFSAYHYWSPQSEPFSWPDFVFRTVCGMYFGVLLLWRGFGITAGAHVSYDMWYFIARSFTLA